MAPVKVKLVILLLTAVSSDALSPLAPVRAAKRVFLRRGGASPTLPINSQDVADAQQAWGDGIVEIGRIYTAKGDYKAEAVKVLGDLYGWGSDLDVLFKPTKAANPAIRLDYDEALSYFVGAALCGNQNLRRVRAESSRRPPRHRRDACSTAWRCRPPPLDRARMAASSPRNDLVKNCRVHPAHWLIYTQVLRAN